MSGAGAPPGPDAAWVMLETSLDPARLAAFCSNLERLYRINPFLEFASWEQSAPDRFRAEVLNHSNGRRMVMVARITRTSDRAFRVDYQEGLKRSTRLEIEPTPTGSRLTITDEYRPTGAGAENAEVDRSLHAWGVALKTYLERDQRWGWMPLYRWSMRRVWLPMKPAARRITILILAIGLADIVLIALGLAIYWIESGR
jgi:hypothetical protein